MRVNEGGGRELWMIGCERKLRACDRAVQLPEVREARWTDEGQDVTVDGGEGRRGPKRGGLAVRISQTGVGKGTGEISLTLTGAKADGGWWLVRAG